MYLLRLCLLTFGVGFLKKMFFLSFLFFSFSFSLFWNSCLWSYLVLICSRDCGQAAGGLLRGARRRLSSGCGGSPPCPSNFRAHVACFQLLGKTAAPNCLVQAGGRVDQHSCNYHVDRNNERTFFECLGHCCKDDVYQLINGWNL